MAGAPLIKPWKPSPLIACSLLLLRRQRRERWHCDSSGIGEHRRRPGRPRNPHSEDCRWCGREGIRHWRYTLPCLLWKGGEEDRDAASHDLLQYFVLFCLFWPGRWFIAAIFGEHTTTSVIYQTFLVFHFTVIWIALKWSGNELLFWKQEVTLRGTAASIPGSHLPHPLTLTQHFSSDPFPVWWWPPQWRGGAGLAHWAAAHGWDRGHHGRDAGQAN